MPIQNQDRIVKLVYTENEWDILEEMSQKKGAQTLRSYVNTRLHILSNVCQDLNENTTIEKKPINYIIPAKICATLISFASHRDIPLAALVRWYASDPLLKEYYDRKNKKK